MELQEFRLLFNKELSALYPKTEIDAFFFRLMKHFMDYEVMDIFLKPSTPISTDTMVLLQKALTSLLNEEPLQYILGSTEFYRFPFVVNKDVLIPRPETEELVDWVLKDIENKKEQLTILDIGCGSGCIPISLKKHLDEALVFALDVSDKAIEVAKLNAIENKVDVTFLQKDILKTEKLDMKFDVITSNPPYVRELEKKEIQNNVLQNEPHLALFVSDEDPLIFYAAIANLALQHLTEKGVLYFEINQYLGIETKEMLVQKGFKNVILKKDLFGKDRMIKAFL